MQIMPKSSNRILCSNVLIFHAKCSYVFQLGNKEKKARTNLTSTTARGVFNFELSWEHSAAKPQKNFFPKVKRMFTSQIRRSHSEHDVHQSPVLYQSVTPFFTIFPPEFKKLLFHRCFFRLN